MNTSLFRFLTAGSVDDGKSTLIGRLLYDSKALYSDQLAQLQSASQSKHGPDAKLDFSLLTDGLREERAHGITIDVAYRYFSTPARKFIIADSPGHLEFTRNMFTAATTADAVVILVDANRIIQEGRLLSQTRRHTQIAALLGIPNFILAVNKMDLLKFNRTDFQQITNMFSEYASGLGVKNLISIPIAALFGDNVAARSEHTPWFHGPSLLQALEQFPQSISASKAPFRFSVQLAKGDHHQILMGRVNSGQIRVGDPVLVQPTGRKAHIQKIYSYKQSLEMAQSGQSVSIELDQAGNETRGCLLTALTNTSTKARSFTASLCWFSETALKLNQIFILKLATQLVTARIQKVLSRIDFEADQSQSVDGLEMNEIGIVEISSDELLNVDSFKSQIETGSFVLIDPTQQNTTCAAGMIQEVLS